MEDINRFVGGRIHFFRKLRGYTLQALAEAIGKSKATVSKYEKSEIAIDIEVLFDIARALGVSVSQLTDYPAPAAPPRRSLAGQSAFSLAETLFLYTYNGRMNQITEGVLRILPTETADQVAFYMDVTPGAEDYHDCRAYYQGWAEYHTSLISFVMKNQFNEAEQLLLYLYNPIDRGTETPAMLCGLARQNLQPMAMRCIVSLNRLKMDDALKERLLMTRQELQSIRRLNFFTVENTLGEIPR